jgi:hypothetical protein
MTQEAAKETMARIDPERRCEITKNECGTDTWMAGRPCKCKPCRDWCADYAKTYGLTQYLHRVHGVPKLSSFAIDDPQYRAMLGVK